MSIWNSRNHLYFCLASGIKSPALPQAQYVGRHFMKAVLTMKIGFVFLCLMAEISSANCQTVDSSFHFRSKMEKSTCLIGGYNFWKYSLFEIGVSRLFDYNLSPHNSTFSYYLSSEFKFSTSNPLIGPKIGFYFTGGSSSMAFGMSLISYTNFDKVFISLKPDIGFGMEYLKITYGYNCRLINQRLDGTNRHVVSATYNLVLTRRNRVNKNERPTSH